MGWNCSTWRFIFSKALRVIQHGVEKGGRIKACRGRGAYGACILRLAYGHHLDVACVASAFFRGEAYLPEDLCYIGRDLRFIHARSLTDPRLSIATPVRRLPLAHLRRQEGPAGPKKRAARPIEEKRDEADYSICGR